MTRSGTAPFEVDGERFETWYRIDGDLADERRPPLVALHGGPGGSHDYLLALTDLAQGGRAVILYDQLGSGNSSHIQGRGSDFWTIGLFVGELQNLLARLEVGHHHLLGQSWGGYLAQEVALTRPAGLRSLILADTAASVPDFVAECDRLRADLPAEVEALLRRHEADGTTADPAYREACRAFDVRHLCRLEPWPDELLTTLAKTEQDPTVYEVMNGPSDFFVTGSLRDWQSKERLGEIRVPTLILSGRYDQMTPALQEDLRAGIPGSSWVLFDASSHLPHLEERERFMDVVGSWLEKADAGEAAARTQATI